MRDGRHAKRLRACGHTRRARQGTKPRQTPARQKQIQLRAADGGTLSVEASRASHAVCTPPFRAGAVELLLHAAALVRPLLRTLRPSERSPCPPPHLLPRAFSPPQHFPRNLIHHEGACSRLALFLPPVRPLLLSAPLLRKPTLQHPHGCRREAVHAQRFCSSVPLRSESLQGSPAPLLAGENPASHRQMTHAPLPRLFRELLPRLALAAPTRQLHPPHPSPCFPPRPNPDSRSAHIQRLSPSLHTHQTLRLRPHHALSPLPHRPESRCSRRPAVTGPLLHQLLPEQRGHHSIPSSVLPHASIDVLPASVDPRRARVPPATSSPSPIRVRSCPRALPPGAPWRDAALAPAASRWRLGSPWRQGEAHPTPALHRCPCAPRGSSPASRAQGGSRPAPPQTPCAAHRRSRGMSQILLPRPRHPGHP